MKKQLFQKYHRRIVREAVLKSILYGLIVGSAAMFVAAFFSWFFGFRSGIWLSVGLFGAGLIMTALLLYFLKFRPTTKQIAARVDSLGLEERLITMIELENENTYIATRQREDALHAMSKVDSMLIKVVVSSVLIMLLAASLLVGIGGGTVSSLYYAGAIPSGMELIKGEEELFTFTCTYTVDNASSGVIVLWTDELEESEGDVNASTDDLTPIENAFKVQEGEDAPAVYAVPAPGYAFIGWSDGVRDPYRQDKALKGSIQVTATFVKVGLTVEGAMQDGYFQEGDGNGGGGPSDFDGGGSEGEGDPSDSNDGSGGGDDPSNGGRHDMDNQQIIDRQHYYGDSFEDSYSDAEDRLSSDSNISDDMKGWISDYYDSIGTGSGNGSGEGSGEGSGGGEEVNP